MIATILLVGLAFYWLGRETDWLRVRLLIGAEITAIVVKFEPMLCRNCDYNSRLHSWRTCGKSKERWSAWELPARTITAHGSVMNFNKGCNLYRASLLKDIHLSQTTNRPIKGLPVRQMPAAMYNPYGTRERPPSYESTYGEPEIEILVNGESKGKFNGDYKRGMIKQLIKANRVNINNGGRKWNIQKLENG